MDETDLSGLSVGNRTIYTFSAQPETTYEGEVIVIEPSLQTIDGSSVVVAWGTLPEKPSFDLLIGMTIDVEIIAGEAKDALIIPVQALREITAESYAVFVVQEDGSLKLTPVSIGLRDFANAEVLAGLNAGDVISTGTVETK
jgi:multidrug efflux pump subunit AcrA (membrane-fusion protein)